MARPTKYNEKLDKEICERLASGQSLNSICKDKHMPDRTNVMRWLLATENPVYDKFRTNYAQAREIQYQCMADDIIDICDDGENDYMVRTGKDGSESWVLNGEHVQRSRLRVDTRKWFMSKVLPKFRDKEEVVTANDGSVTINIIDAKKPSADE